MKLDYYNGFRTALIITLASVLALVLDVDDPWWSGMLALTVANANWSNAWFQGGQRIIGIYIGMIVGYLFVILFKDVPILQMASIGGLAALAVYKRLASPDYNIAWLLGTISAMLALYISVVEVDQLFSIMTDWGAAATIGIGSATIVMYSLTKDSPIGIGAGPITIRQLDDVERSWVIALCITAGVVSVLAPVVYVGHDLVAMLQITITTLIVLYGPAEDVKKLALNRMAGCLLGGGLGLLFVALGLETFFWWLAIYAGTLFFVCSLHHSTIYWAYSGTQAGYAFIVAALASAGPVNDIEGVLDRLVGIYIGAFLSIAVLFAVRVWQGRQVHDIKRLVSESEGGTGDRV
ncbi:hypothetical protein PSE_1666 [Pseudovibrio sp. FO-BEG1]|uniref:FUSC family protein n=1 Tax=Pseudovibrio sp. (strain FO-BEG1) TaxID=911045 RepID=UPI000238C85D|nr:FUSC family protein [Pseudovibrio sp. FO-BEG1]AEV36178.1 hypothetical protein PSE_1666 [Pseudovibrio sp. FO-BEG1]